MRLYIVYSSVSKRACWMVMAEDKEHVWKWLQKHKVPYAKDMFRFSVRKIEVSEIGVWLRKDHTEECTITVCDRYGKETGKKKARLKRNDVWSEEVSE